MDCAGAVQLAEQNDKRLDVPGGIDRISENDIAKHLRSLRGDSADWVLPAVHDGQFSLPGAQAKFTLSTLGDGWGVAWGSEPSTHIVKPGIDGLADEDVVEHMSLDAARRIGLNCASSQILTFEDQTAIVVQRFDRDNTGGTLSRIHQEDVCQALGIHPASKYQADGGPGIDSSVRLLRDVIRGPAGRDAVWSFLTANAYNWLISATDAHAKNYSILRPGRAALAPLYDVASSLAYPAINPRRVKLAMSVGGRYRIHEITPDHWATQAKEVGVDPERLVERIRVMNAQLPDAFNEAASTLQPGAATVQTELVDKIADRCRKLARELDQPVNPTTGSRSSASGVQPRAGALGATKHRGRYAPKQNTDANNSLGDST